MEWIEREGAKGEGKGTAVDNGYGRERKGSNRIMSPRRNPGYAIVNIRNVLLYLDFGPLGLVHFVSVVYLNKKAVLSQR